MLVYTPRAGDFDITLRSPGSDEGSGGPHIHDLGCEQGKGRDEDESEITPMRQRSFCILLKKRCISSLHIRKLLLLLPLRLSVCARPRSYPINEQLPQLLTRSMIERLRGFRIFRHDVIIGITLW